MKPTPDAADRRALLRDALQAVDQLQKRLEASERARREPIAIVGMSCRFPGGANDPESYWDLLREGRDAIREVPRDRWDIDAYFDADPNAPGKTSTRWGGFLDQVDQFDPGFFGISPREAVTMDPQQRLLLEVTSEALDGAGYAPEALAGTPTGVFVGMTTLEYSQLMRLGTADFSDVYSATGNALNAAAGRLSFVLGLQGPCMAIDTACSSSLVAVHLACQSLRMGETRMAIAGGANVLLAPEPFVLFSKWGMMARDGRCKTFDAAADGFVRAEGCGVVLLKRLSDAVADGDHIMAVVRGSAVNQDGRSSGLTVPNGPAQELVVRTALSNASVAARDVDYVEAHGTGTPIGDPIEIEALHRVFGRDRGSGPLLIGSVKTNLGHTEAASGIAGLIKVVLSLQHQEIPAHLHFTQPNPRLDWDAMSFRVPVGATPWLSGERPRIAGVSSFGFTGTNAHVVLSEAPVAVPRADTADRPVHVIALSAPTEHGLEQLAERVAQRLGSIPDSQVADAAFSLAVGRTHHHYRLAVSARTSEEAAQRILRPAGSQGEGVVRGEARSSPRIAFLFTGQGSQYVGMGARLYATEPVFRDALDRCDELLRPRLDRPLLSVMFAPEGDSARALDETAYTQPALFALEFALAELWRSWGIEPAIVLGHSVGEYVAACAAGVFSLEDGLRLIAARGALMQRLPRGGAMAAIAADARRVADELQAIGGGVVVAAVNAPSSTVISGAAEPVAAVVARFASAGVFCQALPVSHAFHSQLLEPMLDEFEAEARTVAYSAPRIALISNLTGAVLPAGEIPGAAYWRRHARETVRFADGIRALADARVSACLEIGPAPTLIGLARQSLADSPLTWIGSLKKGRDDAEAIALALAALYCHGVKVDWRSVHRPFSRRRVPLPPQPFQRKRYWVRPAAPALPADHRAPGSTGANPLLGAHVRVVGETETHVWQGELSTTAVPWLVDHRVQQVPVVPATAFVEMVGSAVHQAFGEGPTAIFDAAFKSPLRLPDDAPVQMQLTLNGASDTDLTFRIVSSLPDGAWTEHVTGRVRRGAEVAHATSANLEDIRARCADEIAGGDFYAAISAGGNEWGPTFQGVSRLWVGNGEALAEVTAPEAVKDENGNYRFHPALADACGHALTATLDGLFERMRAGESVVGAGIEENRTYKQVTGSRLWAWARRRSGGSDGRLIVGDVVVVDDRGEVVSEAVGVRLFVKDAAAGAESRSRPAGLDDRLLEPAWVEAPRDSDDSATAAGVWLVVADDEREGEALASALTSRGGSVVSVSPGVEFAETGPNRFSVNALDPAGFTALLNGRAFAAGVRGTVYLSSGAGRDDRGDECPVLQDDRGLPVALHLAQALRGSLGNVGAPYAVVTRGAQPAGAVLSPLSLGAAPLWGFCRALMIEEPSLNCRLFDLDPSPDPGQEMHALVAELIGPDPNEHQVAWRGSRRLAFRLVRSPVGESRPLALNPDATYMVTGAFGGLGLEAARWLVENGARRLSLVGRRAPSESAETLIRALEGAGADVTREIADVANQQLMAGVFSRVPPERPLRGIIHAAGVLDDGVLAHQTMARVRNVLDAKGVGAWVLHTLSRDLPLDFFVLYSGGASLFGSAGQTSYAAANAFLDALAHERARVGQAALSINWGPWAGIGMAARLSARDAQKLVGRGVAFLTPSQGTSLLQRAIEQGHRQAVAIAWDWGAMDRVPPLLELAAPARAAAPVARERRATLIDRWADADDDARPQLIRTFIRDQVGTVLGYDQVGARDDERGLTELGLDSLMAVELSNRLSAAVGRSLPATLAFEQPTIAALAGHLAELLDSEYPGPSAAAVASDQAVQARTGAAAAGALARGASSPDAAEGTYAFEWRLAEGGSSAPTDLSRGGWVVLADGRGVADALIERLQDSQIQVPVVHRDRSPDLDAALAAALETAGECRGVICLWPLDSPDTEPGSGDRAFDIEGLAVLAQALDRRGPRGATPLYVVTRGAHSVDDAGAIAPSQAPVWGLADTLRADHASARCVAIDLDPFERDVAAQLVSELQRGSDDDHVAFRRGKRYVRRLRALPDPQAAVRAAAGGAEAYGLVLGAGNRLDELTFAGQRRVAPGPGQVELRPRAGGVNFRDVLTALGTYPGAGGPLGLECAGTVVAVGEGVDRFAPGDEVFGLTSGAFATHVLTTSPMLAHRPAWLSPEQAACIPVPFLTAWYGLHELARLKAGERVLIHAAAGGVGMAAVMIAKAAGAEVFGTAGSPHKRRLVEELGATAVFDSRSASFGARLMDLTGGRGVDVVLNSLTGEFITVSLASMAPGGRFLEMGKREILEPAAVAAVNPSVSYRAFDLADVANTDPGQVQRMLGSVLDALAAGTLQPLPVRAFELVNIGDAFRYMAQAKHVGKIALTQYERLGRRARLHGRCDADATYLITGWDERSVREVIPWLVGRGARHIVLASGAGASDGLRGIAGQAEAQGAAVEFLQADMTNRAEVDRLVATLEGSSHPLRGVIHIPARVTETASGDEAGAVFSRRMLEAWRLHEATKDIALDFFLFLSSLGSDSGVRQRQDCAIDAYLGAVADLRRERGLPALSVAWGGWSDLGSPAAMSARNQIVLGGDRRDRIAPEHALDAVDACIDAGISRAMVFPVAWPHAAEEGIPAQEADEFEGLSDEALERSLAEELDRAGY